MGTLQNAIRPIGVTDPIVGGLQFFFQSLSAPAKMLIRPNEYCQIVFSRDRVRLKCALTCISRLHSQTKPFSHPPIPVAPTLAVSHPACRHLGGVRGNGSPGAGAGCAQHPANRIRGFHNMVYPIRSPSLSPTRNPSPNTAQSARHVRTVRFPGAGPCAGNRLAEAVPPEAQYQTFRLR